MVNNMTGKEYTVSKFMANVFGVLFMFLVIIIVFNFFRIFGEISLNDFLYLISRNSIFILVVLLILAILHEFLHAICFILSNDAGWKDIKFGIHWKWLIFYAHLKVPISKSTYRISILLPGIILGIIPTVCGMIFENVIIAFVGAVMTGAAGGDLVVIWMLRAIPSDRKILDHPSECGFILINNND